MTIMALDYGDRFVGVAITDNDGKIALRHSVIDSQRQKVFVEIWKVVASEKVGKVLVGVPVGLSGIETMQTKKTREFVKSLKQNIGEKVLVEEADETFTSKEARRKIIEEGGKKDEEHAEAARLILENYLK